MGDIEKRLARELTQRTGWEWETSSTPFKPSEAPTDTIFFSMTNKVTGDTFVVHVTARSVVVEAAAIAGFDRAINALLGALVEEDGKFFLSVGTIKPELIAPDTPVETLPAFSNDRHPESPGVKLRLLTTPSAELFSRGEVLFFEGLAGLPIHRAGPEHFKLERLSEPRDTLQLRFGSAKDSYTSHARTADVYRYNTLWQGMQFYIAPTQGGLLRQKHKLGYVFVGATLDLQRGESYRLTWACWPVGATKAVEATCDFKLE